MQKYPSKSNSLPVHCRRTLSGLLGIICVVLLLLMLPGCGRKTKPEPPPASEQESSQSGDVDRTCQVNVGGVDRTYRVHIPPSYEGGTPIPLIVAFHGGGGTGEGMERLTHMNDISDSGGFIAVYPDGVNKNWNDGRPQINPDVDDVAFVRSMLERLESDYSIDTKRVYATGISNGGFMSYRLAFDLDGTFAAIAPVGALMTEQLYARPPPAGPVSVLLIEGIDDPFVPWAGGDISTGRLKRGTVVSTGVTIDYWVKAGGCVTPPAVTEMTDAEPDDGTRVREELYSGGREGTEVELLAVEGGGHTWPGGLQYLRERTIGKTCRDIDASRVIWDFFKGHSK